MAKDNGEEREYVGDDANAEHPAPDTTVPVEEAIGPGDDMAVTETVGNAYFGEEEIGLKMKPTVIGPPAYGSPDPETSAGRLVPVEHHPLTPLGMIGEDYGADAGGDAVAGSEGSHHGPPSLTDLERDRMGGEGDYDEMKVPELKEEAKARDIEGYSTMNKKELVKALEKSDAEADSPDNS